MNTEFARRQMVEQQIRTWDVLNDAVLATLANIPREEFVPAGFESLAFAETEIPLAHGEFMMTPTLEGRLLQALQLQGTENVLEIGTGSGFVTACLADLAARVTSLDIHADFLQMAAAQHAACEVESIELLEMDATQSLPDGFFDAIAVTGSLQTVDQRLAEALTVGGRMFVVVGNAPAMEARIVTRVAENQWDSDSLFETELAPLRNGALPPQFTF